MNINMCSALNINKENVDIAINAILWYGSGWHGRNTDIDVQILMQTFDCNDYNSIQAVYNALIDYQLETKCEYITKNFIKCPQKLISAPIKECRKNVPLAVRAILYSLQDDKYSSITDIDDAAIAMAVFYNDMEESIRNEYE